MNDQHPHAGYAGYDGQATGSYVVDPFLGSAPGAHDTPYAEGGYDTGQTAAYGFQYGSAHSTQWDTGAHPTASYENCSPYGTQTQTQTQHDYAAGPTYDTTATWTSAAYDTAATTTMTAATAFDGLPAQGGAVDATGQWDTGSWYGTGQWATTGTAVYGTGAYDTGAYDATAWNGGAAPEPDSGDGPGAADGSPGLHETAALPVIVFDDLAAPVPGADDDGDAFPGTGDASSGTGHGFTVSDDEYSGTGHSFSEAGHGFSGSDDDSSGAGHDAESGFASATGASDDADTAGVTLDPHRSPDRPAPRGGGRSRRRSPAKRSALLTVAVPSACVMSVAGIAAASVSGLGGEDKKDDSTTMAAADPGSVKPAAANNKLDTQLANLSADAENFAGRANRAQARIDLRERQAAEKKRRLEEAARKERLRPKFVMPVAQHGLSAYFGQAGVNWMSVHTGIDFPVSYGTPVMAATDGTVRTQWNSAYGNMAIVTMADGTETWYCHLSSTKIRSGPVKAGDVIAYSGNSGNSTGPHLHFEVRPGGGAAVDPLPWLRSHAVDPT
ncbi:M23 family metallopeptidase [Streptomyces sp. PTD5-9]|uniref:M23 family metallopeptidase n=1 Tax=Streptomyces sp. PTD5-9 TaxID=3120150 RepID=UPI0030091331